MINKQFLTLVASLLICTTSLEGSDAMISKPFLTQEDIGIIRTKIKTHDWAANAYHRMKQNADALFAAEACLDEKRENALVMALESAAVIYAIDGEAKYISKIEERLKNTRNFAELFGACLSSTHNFGCNTRVASGGMSHFFICFEVVKNKISAETSQYVLDNIIVPVARFIQSNNRYDSNWQTHHIAAVLAAGVAAGDHKMAAWAITELKRQMTVVFREDGLHWEGSVDYHFYALKTFLLAAEIARRCCGVELFFEGEERPYIKRMLEAPIQIAFPDGSLPTNNDSHTISLFDFVDVYELGYAHYHDPTFAWILEQGGRSSLFSLLFGEEEIQTLTPESQTCRLSQSGWSILKSVEGKEYWHSDTLAVVFDHGPHGDWHGHPDKLGIEVFAGGRRWIQDAGTPQGYHNQLHWQYLRRTLAHNTVVVDCQDQMFNPSRDNAMADIAHSGQLLEFDKSRKLAKASADWVYANVKYTRQLSIKNNVLEDVFTVSSHTAHIYDYILHGRGMVEVPGLHTRETQFEQYKNGYEYFVDVACATTDHEWRALFKDGGWPDGCFVPNGKTFEIRVAGQPETEIYTGYAPSEMRGVYTPFILIRRKTRETAFRCSMNLVICDM